MKMVTRELQNLSRASISLKQKCYFEHWRIHLLKRLTSAAFSFKSHGKTAVFDKYHDFSISLHLEQMEESFLPELTCFQNHHHYHPNQQHLRVLHIKFKSSSISLKNFYTRLLQDIMPIHISSIDY